MNDYKNLEACLSMHSISLGDGIIKQFWEEKKSTLEKKKKKNNKKEVFFFLNAHSDWQELNSLECQCHLSHARSTSHLTYWGLWAPHTAKSREEMLLTPHSPSGCISVTRLTKKTTVSFHALLWTRSKHHQQGFLATAHRRLLKKQSSFKQQLSLRSRQQEIHCRKQPNLDHKDLSQERR